MLSEVEKFIHHIRNYTVNRSASENVFEQEQELISKWHKNRLKECHDYLKFLNTRPDNQTLKEEIKAITELTKEIELNFAKWKGLNTNEY